MNVIIPDEFDRSALVRLDTVCYDYPLDFEIWTDALSNNTDMKCGVIKHGRTLVGYCVYFPLMTEQSEDPLQPDELFIMRLGIHPRYRRHRYGSVFIEHIRKYARENWFKKITTMIPEFWPEKGERPHVMDFLKDNQFKQSKIMPGVYRMFGNNYDGIVFETGLKYEQPRINK
jgi:GNAT superfamily N-acetyltransferase